jgi:O-methyltransferase domain
MFDWLWCWDDVHAVAILRRCAEAASTTGRVLLIEHALLEDADESGLRVRKTQRA